MDGQQRLWRDTIDLPAVSCLGQASSWAAFRCVLGRTIHQKLLCSPMNHHSHSTHRLLCLRDSDGFCQHGANRVCPPHAGLADRREISTDQRKHLEKFLPAFRFQLFGMERTANFLESWLNGTYERSKLLDVSACLSSRKWKSFKKIWCSFFIFCKLLSPNYSKLLSPKSSSRSSLTGSTSLSPFVSLALSLSLSLSRSLSFSLCVATRYAGAWLLRALMSFAQRLLRHSRMHSALNPTLSSCFDSFHVQLELFVLFCCKQPWNNPLPNFHESSFVLNAICWFSKVGGCKPRWCGTGGQLCEKSSHDNHTQSSCCRLGQWRPLGPCLGYCKEGSGIR